MPAALVFAAAPLAPTPRLRSLIASLESPYIVAADDGATTALAFGLTPDLVIGDLDSIQPSTLARLRDAHVPIDVRPRDKDATDGQLAIERALESEPDTLYLLGFLGGPRLDQALANILLLSRIEVPTVVVDEGNECRLVRANTQISWETEPSEVVSLIPIAGDVDGVQTDGLRWPLHHERLVFGDSRGVSNEPSASRAVVRIRAGLLLVTRHFPEEPLGL